MPRKTVLSLFIFLIFLASCQQPAEKMDIITFHPSEYDVILFADNSNLHIKEKYMDAIIELKAKYPSEFNQVSTSEKTTNEMKYSVSHNENPTLLITKNGQTVKKLSGPTPKQEILKYLEMTME